MAKWVFERHAAAGFVCATYDGDLCPWSFQRYPRYVDLRPAYPRESSVEVVIDTKNIWTGEPDRDAHLRSADFLDIERYPQITFKGADVILIGANECILNGDLTIRGVKRKSSLRVKYLGQWQTPWWEDGWTRVPKHERVSSPRQPSIATISG